MTDKLYKITGPNGEAINGGSGVWHLPAGTRPGKWMPKVEHVEACKGGYHLVASRHIAAWLPRHGGILWEAEGRGEQSAAADKVAFAQARLITKIGVLDDVSMRLAAADIAERVLSIFERARPGDDRPRKAIQAARDFARSKIDATARAAAWAAARDAAWAAAWDAAGDAARAAAGAAAWAAAWDAAWAAAEAAAEAAARAAAWDAARDANARAIIKQAKDRLKEARND